MKAKLYLPTLLLLMTPCVSVYSQLTDLSLIESLPRIVEEAGPESGDETKEDKEESTTPKQEPNFEDENYGYTGGKSFVNPPQEIFFDETLSYFGYDFFVDAPTTFAATNIPVPPDYVLGPEDNIKIILFGSKSITYELTVTRDGEIFFPEVGSIAVAGLTFQDLKETIQQITENQLIGTKAIVTLGSLRSIDIFVLGEAYQPGMYTVSALSTLTNAIFKSGGVNVTGSLRNIQLKRQGKVISTLDFYDLLLKGDTSNDIRLTQGDVVFIPPTTKTVGISGEVSRPSIYELKDNETLGDLIKLAGNLKPKADIFSANIHRVDPSVNGFSLIPVELNDSSLSSFKLNNGDVLSIHPVIDNLKNAVLMSGHAQQPGFFPWQQGMKISDLIKSSSDLLSMTDMSYVLIKREDKFNQNYQFLQVDLEKIFKDDASDANILLSEKDEIILFPSLLTPEQITTKLIQDKYLIEDNQLVLEEDEWSSMSYLRKSLMEEETSNKQSGERMSSRDGINTTGASITGVQDVGRYYEYSIYDYCAIPGDLAKQIVESSGFRIKKSIPLEELENLSNPEDFTNLKQEIENERVELQETVQHEQLIPMITDLCRKQLLEPIIELINRQVTPNNEKKTISVYGSVHFPGTYPLTQGMVLGDAIKATGGLKDATYDSEIELSRSNNIGKKFSITRSFVSITDIEGMQKTLQEMDIINLKQISTNVGTVEITGEIYFSGTYPISENQTISDLINRAGGITEQGSLKAAYFQRESLKRAELDRLKAAKAELRRKILLSTQTAGLGQEKNPLDGDVIEQLSSLIAGTKDEEGSILGRLVVDLESIMNGTSSDVILENGDSLHIPKMRNSISVVGEVFVENSHLYRQDLNVDDYIKLSGGITSYADEAKVYMIKSDGRIVTPSSASGFFKRNPSGIQPGDTIVVPLAVQPFSGSKAAVEITQIAYQMALAAAAIGSL